MMKVTKRLIIGSGCLLGVFGVLGFSTPTSSLTYQEEIPVSFTFNRGVSISLSASDLHIYNLSPGTADSSNVITVSATTNNVTGYVLTASVGNSTKNTTNLVNGSNNFASIATNASEASLTTDNTWGYSISTDDGSSWSNYSGLPIFSSATWKELANVNTNGTTSIKFKIGAKASSSQASGDYTNVINFTATANYVPYTIDNMYYMQDFANLSFAELTNVLSSMTQNTQYTLKDSRDQQDYTITKLSDGNVWMTKNLNLAGGTTVTAVDTNTDRNYTLPESSTTGFGGDYAYVYNSSSTTCSNTSPCYSYYSSYATFAAHGMSTTESNYSYDICPKGWRVPLRSEYTTLLGIYSTGATLTSTPFQAVYSGRYMNSTFSNGGTNGYYWSSTYRYQSDDKYGLYFSENSSNATSITYERPGTGAPVRCIVKQ